MNTYEFTYQNGDTVFASGATPSAAKYAYYLRLDGIYENFREFLRVKIKVRKVAPPKDAYAYISRAYGKNFHVGQEVLIPQRGTSEKELGIVAYPNGNQHYVHVCLTSDGSVGMYHPSDVDGVMS